MSLFIVGDFLDPKKETDETFPDWLQAYERMEELSSEKENYVVGMWEDENDYALFISINGETFKAQ